MILYLLACSLPEWDGEVLEPEFKMECDRVICYNESSMVIYQDGVIGCSWPCVFDEASNEYVMEVIYFSPVNGCYEIVDRSSFEDACLSI